MENNYDGAILDSKFFKDFSFKADLVKSQEKKEIIDFVTYNRASFLKYVVEIRNMLDLNGIYVPGKEEKLVETFILSCILSRIADQMSPHIRSDNIEKIMMICSELELNYNLLIHIVPYTDKILNNFIVNLKDNNIKRSYGTGYLSC